MKINSTVFLEFPDGYIFDIIQKMITHKVKEFFKIFKGFIVVLLEELITIGEEG